MRFAVLLLGNARISGQHHDRGAAAMSHLRFSPDSGKVKGTAAEALPICSERQCWAVGEYPPDCHESGELSCLQRNFFVQP